MPNSRQRKKLKREKERAQKEKALAEMKASTSSENRLAEQQSHHQQESRKPNLSLRPLLNWVWAPLRALLRKPWAFTWKVTCILWSQPKKVWRFITSHKLPLVYTSVIAAEVLGAIFVNERDLEWLNSLLGVSLCPTKTYAQKWEFFALVAAFINVLIFWIDQMVTQDRREFLKGPYLAVSNSALLFSLICLVLAWRNLSGNVTRHLLYVLGVAVFFFIGDIFTYFGVDRSVNHEKKTQARLFFIFADCPVVISFLVLGFYHYHFIAHKNLADEATEFFVAGSIAFQYLASNIIFLLIVWCGSWLLSQPGLKAILAGDTVGVTPTLNT